MLDLKTFTCTFKVPVTGTVRDGEKTASWTIETIDFNFVTDGQAQPPDWLAFKLHAELVDANGHDIPIEILSLLDLECGLRDAFQREFGAAWDAVESCD